MSSLTVDYNTEKQRDLMEDYGKLQNIFQYRLKIAHYHPIYKLTKTF